MLGASRWDTLRDVKMSADRSVWLEGRSCDSNRRAPSTASSPPADSWPSDR